MSVAHTLAFCDTSVLEGAIRIETNYIMSSTYQCVEGSYRF